MSQKDLGCVTDVTVYAINTRQMGLGGKRPYVECQTWRNGEHWVGRMIQESVVRNVRYLAIRWKVRNGVAQGLFTYEVVAEDIPTPGKPYGPQYRCFEIHTGL